MRILLVSPNIPVTFWSTKYAIELTGRKVVLPPLGLLTVAAMLPETWEKQLIDLAITALQDDDIRWADYVFVGGMNVQGESARDVIDRCKALGAKVVAGGPLFTAIPERFDNVDHLVLGEAEVILPRFLEDLENGCPSHLYRAEGWADLHVSPAPLWDLIDIRHYWNMPIQYSRGCPFNCDFCDVTTLFGRRVRTKTVEQILDELDRLDALGWRREVFFVDDNFIADRQTLKQQVLPAIIDWMERHRHPFSLYTQASINLADDDELLRLMGDAGFESVFIGIETVGDSGFAECNKVQNKGRDLVACVRKIQNAGMEVQGGFILGFDSDPPGIFDDMIAFIQEAGIATAMVGMLQAFVGTQLYARLERENRVLGEAAQNTDGVTNIVPAMGIEQLNRGYRRVVETLYCRSVHYERVWRFLDNWRPRHKTRFRMGPENVRVLFALMYHLGLCGSDRKQFWKCLAWAIRHPQDRRMVMRLLALGLHFRKVFAEVEARTAQASTPHIQSSHSEKTVKTTSIL